MTDLNDARDRAINVLLEIAEKKDDANPSDDVRIRAAATVIHHYETTESIALADQK